MESTSQRDLKAAANAVAVVKKTVMLAVDDSGSDFSVAVARALEFVLGNAFRVLVKPYDEIKKEAEEVKEPLPDVLFVLELSDSDSQSGLSFLRTYWAELLKIKSRSPQIIYSSFYDLQGLIRKDLRHYVLCAEGVSFIRLPLTLVNIADEIVKYAGRKVSLEIMMEYLVKSYELRIEGLLDHANKNFMAQYLLLLGANSAGDVPNSDFNGVMGKLKDNKAKEEIAIAFSILDKKGGVHAGENETSMRRLLSARNVRVLLIDDESGAYSEKEYCGWTDVLSRIFGDNVDLVPIGGKWKEAGDILAWDPKLKTHLLKGENRTEPLGPSRDGYLLDYDLIFLDLYLTAEDEEIKRRDGDHHPQNYSGLQLLKTIRGIDPTVPVILFTASDKAFNMQAAEGIGIQGYFQKESGQRTESEAYSYYSYFKNLVLSTLDWKKKAVRDLLCGLESYKDISRSLQAGSTVPKPDPEIIGLLKSAFSSLSVFLENGERAQLAATCVLAGNVLEKMQKDNYFIYSDPKTLNDKVTKDPQSFALIACFLAKHIRNAVSHSSADIRFEDGYLTLLAVLHTLEAEITVACNSYIEFPKVDTDCKLFAFPGKYNFAAEAELMLHAFCNQACPGAGNYCRALNGMPCLGSNMGVRDRAMFLSTSFNLSAKEAKDGQILFAYLFSVLCLNRGGNDAELKQISGLIRSRLTFGHDGKLHVPYRIRRGQLEWHGFMGQGDKIYSLMGELDRKSDKVLVVSEAIVGNNTEVFFKLTKNYFRNINI
ncbi:MAG TPA: hypothetical protein DEQ77_04735 [Candidatus Omnitrophica bacterium]|nr:hypothetical protein [Candidatus Omnitrophota bacterium]